MQSCRSSRVLLLGLLLVLLSGPGCVTGVTGLIYRNTTEPLVTNFDDTPVAYRARNGDVKEFRYYVSFRWDSNAIGEIAKKAGFENIYYADLRTLSVLGIWTQRYVELYGN